MGKRKGKGARSRIFKWGGDEGLSIMGSNVANLTFLNNSFYCITFIF
jgi:hypothetical protein